MGERLLRIRPLRPHSRCPAARARPAPSVRSAAAGPAGAASPRRRSTPRPPGAAGRIWVFSASTRASPVPAMAVAVRSRPTHADRSAPPRRPATRLRVRLRAAQDAFPGVRRRLHALDARGERHPQLPDHLAVVADLVAARRAAGQVIQVRLRARPELAEAHEPQELAADATAAHRFVTRTAAGAPATGTRRSTGQPDAQGLQRVVQARLHGADVAVARSRRPRRASTRGGSTG